MCLPKLIAGARTPPCRNLDRIQKALREGMFNPVLNCLN